MRLWKVHVKTHYFVTRYYEFYVLADTESNMLRTVYQHPMYRKDEDVEIEKYEEIDLNNTENRVL